MDWRKSTRSSNTGQCVEVAGWRKASASRANGDCVEAGQCTGGVAVRDTADRGGPQLSFSGVSWGRFLAGLR